MATPRPVRLVDPFIELTGAGTTPVPVVLKCHARGIHLVPEEDDAAATFCDPLGYSWVLTIDLLQSLGTEGLDEALWSLGGPGTVVDFDFAYLDEPSSVDNPHWAGTCRLTAWAVVDSGINEPTEINLEMDVIGDVTRTPTPTVPVVLEQTGTNVRRETARQKADA
jgi:hypothetical protein